MDTVDILLSLCSSSLTWECDGNEIVYADTDNGCEKSGLPCPHVCDHAVSNPQCQIWLFGKYFCTFCFSTRVIKGRNDDFRGGVKFGPTSDLKYE